MFIVQLAILTFINFSTYQTHGTKVGKKISSDCIIEDNYTLVALPIQLYIFSWYDL